MTDDKRKRKMKIEGLENPFSSESVEEKKEPLLGEDDFDNKTEKSNLTSRRKFKDLECVTQQPKRHFFQVGSKFFLSLFTGEFFF